VIRIISRDAVPLNVGKLEGNTPLATLNHSKCGGHRTTLNVFAAGVAGNKWFQLLERRKRRGSIVGFSSCTPNLGMLHTEENPPKK
jgi:hypothetical protein